MYIWTGFFPPFLSSVSFSSSLSCNHHTDLCFLSRAVIMVIIIWLMLTCQAHWLSIMQKYGSCSAYGQRNSKLQIRLWHWVTKGHLISIYNVSALCVCVHGWMRIAIIHNYTWLPQGCFWHLRLFHALWSSGVMDSAKYTMQVLEKTNI